MASTCFETQPANRPLRLSMRIRSAAKRVALFAMHRSLPIAAWGLVLAAALAPTASYSQAYPSKAIKLIVPFSAGGGTDMAGRVLAQQLQQNLGRPVVVDNRPGAGGAIAAEQTARSEPDGHTLLMVSNTFLTNAEITKVPYDTRKDFTPLGLIGTSPYLLLVNASSAHKSASELLKAARMQPDQMSFGSAGPGSVTHLLGELFKQRSGVGAVHVPYKGTSAAITDLLSGQLQFMFADIASALPQVKAGRLRAIAITSSARSPLLPDVPTAAEAGVEMQVVGFYGLLGPARIPADIVAKIDAALHAALANDGVKAQLAGLAIETDASIRVDKFATRLTKEADLWRGVVKESHIKFD